MQAPPALLRLAVQASEELVNLIVVYFPVLLASKEFKYFGSSSVDGDLIVYPGFNEQIL
jgi:hypothetical protein